eukprot:m.68691 g.68691  ORF g.68691 m.68691 type:complete len:80 (-) comp11990_c0_seq3:363-602(-)
MRNFLQKQKDELERVAQANRLAQIREREAAALAAQRKSEQDRISMQSTLNKRREYVRQIEEEERKRAEEVLVFFKFEMF